MKEKTKRILSTFLKMFNILNRQTFKRENRIVLYSNRGFRDNLKAIYDYMIENNYNDKYIIICSVNDYKDYKHLNLKNVKFINNYLGMYYFLTSKYFFYTHGKYPIKPSKKQIVVNLWHGTPLKKIGNLEEHQKDIDYNFFTYVLATSDKFSHIMQQAFGCEKNQVKICGHPRNDLIFNPVYEETEKGKKLVLWLPTHRNYDGEEMLGSESNGNIPIFSNHEKMEILNDKLEKLEMKLIIKLHPTQIFKGDGYKEYNNIKIWSEKEFSLKKYHLYQLLGSSDALITDYSSVYFDYLLLNRPIAFTINDIDLYTKERGFIFEEPEKLMPGFKIKTEKDFYAFLKSLSDDFDPYEEKRVQVNKLVNYYTDGHNSKRVLDMVGINIAK